MNTFEKLLLQMGDLERTIGRIALERSTIADYKSLSRSLLFIPQLKNLLHTITEIKLIDIIKEHIGCFDDLSLLLQSALYDGTEENWIIKDGFDSHLDRLRSLAKNANAMLFALEQNEQKMTGIASLKIKYNAINGYFIEVTNANVHLIPARYQQLKTLIGRERFTTKELKELCDNIEQSQREMKDYEQSLFIQIKNSVAQNIISLRKSTHVIAQLDALLSLSHIAYHYGYVRPTLNNNQIILIKNGRHPIVEYASTSLFIPNDTELTHSQSLWIITGPNMGGKSTYLRQVALICIMAHIGSFVPAEQADIAILDRIFTRLGASDNVSEGKSTFLVEMEEVATICLHATKNSLIILDEVGRGTSTFDGLAIAQAVVEYIFKKIQARCLFATHYHELTDLQNIAPGIVAYYAASKKGTEGIIFLYKILAGIADGSFGIEVAKLAHLPHEIIDRAALLVEELSVQKTTHLETSKTNLDQKKSNRSNIITHENSFVQELLSRIKYIDFDTLSPKKAFDLLWELKDL